MRIDKGEKDGINLNGLSFIIVARSPSPMIDGNLKVGLIVDERADDAQVAAISAITTGAEGGPMAVLAPLVGEVAGVEKRPISFQVDGINFAVKAGGLINQAEEGVASMAKEGEPIYLENTGHPVSSKLALAKAVRSLFNAFGIEWPDTSGTRNGHFAPFSWSA